jgi:glutathione S-transferase
VTLNPHDVIVHHHDAGYYSEKVRALLGAKGLTWHSVIEPLISPKPDFARLTGGYERVPVLQIGADFYCDSKLALLEIERRWPSDCSLSGLDYVINAWVDKILTPATFAVALPDMAPQMAPEFVQDRAELYGPSFDLQAIASASVPMAAQWRAQVSWLESALATSGQPFLAGSSPTIADVAAYIPLWFFGVRLALAKDLATPHTPKNTRPIPAKRPDSSDHARRLLDGFEHLAAWADRMSALGQGDRREATYAEAFAIARDSTPIPAPAHDASDPLGIMPGAAVNVIADDSTRDPVAGKLLAATPERIVLAREDEDLGRVHVHLPRFSYFLHAA